LEKITNPKKKLDQLKKNTVENIDEISLLTMEARFHWGGTHYRYRNKTLRWE
jgi:hypothetical protein